jgi:hypothetical protein
MSLGSCSSLDVLKTNEPQGRTEAKPEPTKIKENFLLEVQYAFHDRNGSPHDECFLLDFVEFAQLDKFEQDIDKDTEIFKSYLAL